MVDEGKKIKIAGFDFVVMWAPELEESPCQGEISYRRQQIRICTSLMPRLTRAKATLLHEIVEAAASYAEIKLDHTDLTRLVTQLYAILADNGLENLEAGLPLDPQIYKMFTQSPLKEDKVTSSAL